MNIVRQSDRQTLRQTIRQIGFARRNDSLKDTLIDRQHSHTQNNNTDTRATKNKNIKK